MTSESRIFCTNCGADNRVTARFCRTCQAPLRPAAAGTAPGVGAAQPARPITAAAVDVTQALPAGQLGFSLLPPGALLGSDSSQYMVLEGWVEQASVRHVYRAEPWAALAGAAPASARCLIVEVHDPALVDRERALISRRLPDTGLWLPVAAFSQQLWEDTPRHYLVYPEKPGVDLRPASGLPRPQRLDNVLRWGALLAAGLQTLHSSQLAHGQVNPHNILVGERDARLAGFGHVRALQKLAREQQASRQQRDLADLAASLQDLLGGPQAALPSEVAGVLQRGPFTSAEAFGQALSQALAGLKPAQLRVRLGHSTHEGQVRDHNEDTVAALDGELTGGQAPLGYGVYMVADGMGGHAGGEDASDLAINAAMARMLEGLRSLDQADGGQMQAVVTQACLAANQAVHAERARSGSDMGTTLVAALRIGDQVVVGNVGDSRAYLVNGQEIRPLTVDHSLVQRLVATGQITPAEARLHPQRNLIYKVVGDKPTVEPDLFDVRLLPGDRLLLCSDGLWEMVDDAIIWQTVLSQPDPQAACQQLIDLANQAGGEDNISVVIVHAG